MFRGLFVLRALQEGNWLEAERRRQYRTGSGLGKRIDSDLKEPLSARDSVPGAPVRRIRPWRISTDVPRAVMDTIIAGIGYLLSVSRNILLLQSRLLNLGQYGRCDDDECGLFPGSVGWYLLGELGFWATCSVIWPLDAIDWGAQFLAGEQVDTQTQRKSMTMKISSRETCAVLIVERQIACMWERPKVCTGAMSIM